MESEGAVNIFLRSIEKYRICYSTFVGDGDSSTYGDVKRACYDKYGNDYTVVKEECVGHVQKRLGNALREYKRKNKGKKLCDGKGISGKNRLTDRICDKMQNHYGSAIRNNSNDKDGMHNAIWAIFKHMIRSDGESLKQQHYYCPQTKDTWCKFWKEGAEYHDEKRLPSAFQEELKPIFVRLSEDKLLERCLLGLTQNQNEAINGILWSNCPKTIFCGKQKVEIAVCETISVFNSGAANKGVVLKRIGIDPGDNMLLSLKKQDDQRVKKAEKKISLSYRQRRRMKRAEKKSKGEKEQVIYKSGAFGLSSKPDVSFEIVESRAEPLGDETKAKKRKRVSNTKDRDDNLKSIKKKKSPMGDYISVLKSVVEPEITFVDDADTSSINCFK